jgi:hypothetical protein
MNRRGGDEVHPADVAFECAGRAMANMRGLI